jgi:hypothetical protein
MYEFEAHSDRLLSHSQGIFSLSRIYMLLTSVPQVEHVHSESHSSFLLPVHWLILLSIIYITTQHLITSICIRVAIFTVMVIDVLTTVSRSMGIANRSRTS